VLEIESIAQTKASPEQVWSLLSDIETWSQWGAWDDVTVEENQGVAGQIHVLHRGRVHSRERVAEMHAPRRLTYDFLSGLPVRNYHAEVTLLPAKHGTTIRWCATFNSKVPGIGWALRRGLQQFLDDTTKRLARAAQQQEQPAQAEVAPQT
jgi:uncharacterized protein YndB with AHSA1/START domain